jgi:regulator of sirC expression with transglutaminase-like and TPR domain
MDVDATLAQLVRDPGHPCDLAELALHLARDEYPHIDVEAYLGELSGMAHEARTYVRGDLAARVHGLCRYLFHEMGFRGNRDNYYDARNSYLNQVLDRRTGIPITLSVVAGAVGRRAGLDVVGVGLPGHFVAKAVADGQEIIFDPFHGGRVLTPGDCEILVEQVTGVAFHATADTVRALPPALVVQRMLTNLKVAYLRDGDFPRAVRVLERLRQLKPNDPHERRDLGVSLLHAGQPGKAIDHLSAYLEAQPEGGDAEPVKQLLARARREVAGWN